MSPPVLPFLDSEPLSLLAALHGFTRNQMFEARRTLEVSIARMAAERASAEQLAPISDAVSGMFAACDDPQAFLVEDIRFHAAVGAASGNPILASVVEMISAMFYEQRRQTADRRRDLRPVAESALADLSSHSGPGAGTSRAPDERALDSGREGSAGRGHSMKRFVSMLLGATIAAGLTAYGYQAQSDWPPALKPASKTSPVLTPARGLEVLRPAAGLPSRAGRE